MKKFNKILYTGILTVTLGMTAMPLANMHFYNEKHDKIFQNLDEDRFLKNDKGQACYLPIHKRGVDVVISNNFTDQQKETIVDAIKYCDQMFNNIEYNIHLDNTKAPKDCIKITSGILGEKTLGETALITNGYIISYPITITLDRCDYKDEYNLDTIVKHELLHTLGLADMYDLKYKDESIMYYTPVLVGNLTDSDVKIINTLYANKLTHTNYNITTYTYEPKIQQLYTQEDKFEL